MEVWAESSYTRRIIILNGYSKFTPDQSFHVGTALQLKWKISTGTHTYTLLSISFTLLINLPQVSQNTEIYSSLFPVVLVEVIQFLIFSTQQSSTHKYFTAM